MNEVEDWIKLIEGDGMNKEEIKTPDILLTALRRYRHNDNTGGLIAGFEYEETIKIVLSLIHEKKLYLSLLEKSQKLLQAEPPEES